MDLLIEIIFKIIKEATQDKPRAVTPRTFQEIEQQKAATEQRIREMQAAMAKQQARTKPAKAKRGPARGAAVAATAAPAKAAPTLSQTPDIWTTPAPQLKAAPLVSSSRGRAPLRELRIPFILGEVLAPPLALRESGF